VAGLGEHAFWDEGVDMRVKVDKRSVRLHGPNHGWNAAFTINGQCGHPTIW